MCCCLGPEWLYSWDWKTINDETVHRDVNFKDKILHEIFNKLFKKLISRGNITDKKLKYFTTDFKKISEFLDCQLKSVMQSSWLYLRD